MKMKCMWCGRVGVRAMKLWDARWECAFDRACVKRCLVKK